MWHSHLHDVEILEKKNVLVPKVLNWVQQKDLLPMQQPSGVATITVEGSVVIKIFFFLKKEQGEFKPLWRVNFEKR